MSLRTVQFMVLVAFCCMLIAGYTLAIRWLDARRDIHVEVTEITECPV